MAVSLTRFSWSLWGVGGGKDKEPPVSNGSSTLSSPSSSEMVKFPLANETEMAPPYSHRKVRRKWQSREERRRVDIKEYDDVVLVPSDGGVGYLSGSESDDSDWSIGWLEPLGSDFQSYDDDGGDGDGDGDDNSFAVLVPCYRHGCTEVQGSNMFLGVIQNLSNEFSSAGKNYMEQWLACLQNFEA